MFWRKIGVKAECVVTDEGSKVLELKNIAVLPECQRMGYGKRMIEFIEQTYRDNFRILRVGTGDSQLTLPFYKKFGFIHENGNFIRSPAVCADNTRHGTKKRRQIRQPYYV